MSYNSCQNVKSTRLVLRSFFASKELPPTSILLTSYISFSFTRITRSSREAFIVVIYQGKLSFVCVFLFSKSAPGHCDHNASPSIFAHRGNGHPVHNGRSQRWGPRNHFSAFDAPLADVRAQASSFEEQVMVCPSPLHFSRHHSMKAVIISGSMTEACTLPSQRFYDSAYIRGSAC